ncbi:hypothetical protein L596_012632 [Steinernema carpocapsae]|uniref:Uncharacterized protein n=1 Tax=Steinernema carpocapsae TaxID=34508 RepID=A0A4U5NXN5_STECR|nr:hypothetical protein L596_012632 [Steinernema carpocapsae]
MPDERLHPAGFVLRRDADFGERAHSLALFGIMEESSIHNIEDTSAWLNDAAVCELALLAAQRHNEANETLPVALLHSIYPAWTALAPTAFCSTFPGPSRCFFPLLLACSCELSDRRGKATDFKNALKWQSSHASVDCSRIQNGTKAAASAPNHR